MAFLSKKQNYPEKRYSSFQESGSNVSNQNTLGGFGSNYSADEDYAMYEEHMNSPPSASSTPVSSESVSHVTNGGVGGIQVTVVVDNTVKGSVDVSLDGVPCGCAAFASPLTFVFPKGSGTQLLRVQGKQFGTLKICPQADIWIKVHRNMGSSIYMLLESTNPPTL